VTDSLKKTYHYVHKAQHVVHSHIQIVTQCLESIWYKL